MDLQTLDWQWYVPTFRGNRERWLRGETPAPLMVELKTPSYGAIRANADRLGKQPDQRLAIDKQYFLGHVRGVKELTLDGTPVAEGAVLWQRGVDENRIDADLFLELFRALNDQAQLAEGLVSGLSGPSASPVTRTPAATAGAR